MQFMWTSTIALYIPWPSTLSVRRSSTTNRKTLYQSISQTVKLIQKIQQMSAVYFYALSIGIECDIHCLFCEIGQEDYFQYDHYCKHFSRPNGIKNSLFHKYRSS